MGQFYQMLWAEVQVISSRIEPKPTMEMVIQAIGIPDGKTTIEHDGVSVPIEVSGNEIEISIGEIQGDLKKVYIPCLMNDEGTLSDNQWTRVPFLPIEAEIGDRVLEFPSDAQGVWQTVRYLSSLPKINKITQIWISK